MTEPLSASRPTPDDERRLDEIAKAHLGDQAVAHFIEARARGVKGDEATYAQAVQINDPDIVNQQNRMAGYYEQLGKAAKEVNETIDSAGNVVIDITPLARPDIAAND